MDKIVRIVLEKASEAIAEILNMSTELVRETPTPVPPAPPVTALDSEPGAPTQPEPPIPTAPPVAAAAALDSEGLPWDSRIHASTRTKLAKDQTWKLKRGTDPIVVARVKTELRNAQGSVDSPLPLAPAPLPDNDAPSWAKLVSFISNNGIDSAIVLAACNKFNIEDLNALKDSPSLIPLVSTELGA